MLREIYHIAYVEKDPCGTITGSKTISLDTEGTEDSYINLIPNIIDDLFGGSDKVVITSVTKLYSRVIDEVK